MNFIYTDNRNEEDEWGPWQAGGWPNRGLKLIDYGRSIDLKLYPEGTKFKGDSHTDSFRCIEMQQGKPWTFQIDIFGICAVVHCLLFGNYMEVTQDPKTRKWRPKESLKRFVRISL
jgi:checkpoint serine/threonine-protein kinase